MLSYKRGFLEIIAEILEKLIQNPLKKTHISFRCNLDSRAVTKYLRLMESAKLIKKSEMDPTIFMISQKGINYLTTYKDLIKIIETAEGAEILNMQLEK